MKTQIRYAAYSLVGITIALTLLLAFPKANLSRARAHASASNARLVPGIVGLPDEATVTMKSTDMQTFNLFNYAFPSNTVHWPCVGKLEGLHGPGSARRHVRGSRPISGRS